MSATPGAAAYDHRTPERFHLGGRSRVALIATAALAWSAALVLWTHHGIDETLVHWSAGLDPHGAASSLAAVASRYGKPAMGMILLLGLVGSVTRPSWRRYRKLYLLTLMSLAIAGIAGDLMKELVGRPRPAVQYPDLSFAAPESTTSSFPSGHSTKSLALALPALLFVSGWGGWRGLGRCALALLAASVCASRVVLGAHFLSDVVGGLAVALSGLPLAVLASNSILSQMTAADLDRAGRIWIGVYVLLIVILLMLS